MIFTTEYDVHQLIVLINEKLMIKMSIHVVIVDIKFTIILAMIKIK